VLLAVSLLSLAACVGCGEVHTRTALGRQRPVVIALAGPPSALYAPIYEAQANGDFTRAAIGVRVQTPSGGQSPLTLLAAHQASMAVVSEPELLAARDGGAHLVAIGALVQGPLESIISLGTHPITRPSQLAGQTVATSGSALADAELDTVLSHADVAPSRVRTITRSGDLDTALQTHKATATLGGYWDFDAVALTIANLHPSVIRLGSAGVPTFSELVIVVRVDEARYDGALLRAFLQSLTRGEAAVRAEPQATAALLHRINPQLSERFELAALTDTAPATAPTRSNDPYGYQYPQLWQKFGDWMAAHGLIRSAGSAGFAITDEFLPGQGEGSGETAGSGD
jgi:ABC-type nitrate/sulfonate/bicarbonate transport system substrate-binding protein